MRKLLRDRRGAGAIEYALVASLISVAAVAAFHGLGDKLQSSYSNTASSIGDAL